MANRSAAPELVVYFQDLSLDKAKREENALKLTRHMTKLLKKGSDSEHIEATKYIVAEVCKLFQNKHKADLFNGTTLIYSLVTCEALTIFSDVNMQAFSNCLMEVSGSTDEDLANTASAAIGALLKRGLGSLTARFVSQLADKTLEWLEHTARQESRRLSAAVILGHAAQYQPVALQPYTPRIFKHIFACIKDQKIAVREAGVETLRLCLITWRDRQYFPGIFHAIERGLQEGKDEPIHGCLLAASVFVENTGDFVPTTSYYGAICDTTLKYKDRTGPAQMAVVSLIVALARKSLVDFVEYTSASGRFMPLALSHVLRIPLRDRDRSFFLAKIRDLVESVKEHCEPYAARLILELLAFLKKPKATEELPGVCDCIAALAHALGDRMQSYVPQLVDPLFDLGLSEAQARALHALSEHSDRSYVIQRRMLNTLSDVLLKQPFSPFGLQTPRPAVTQPVQTKSTTKQSKRGKDTDTEKRDAKKDVEKEKRDAEVLLALRILSTFTFTHNVLTMFARDAVVPNLSHDNDAIRLQAAQTCAQIVLPVQSLMSRVDCLLVTDVLSSLVALAAADRKSIVRRTVLHALAPSLDSFLAKAEVVQNLFPCIHDTDDEARVQALKVICRVSAMNPVYTLPALCNLLFQLLAHMKFAGPEDQRGDLVLLRIIIADAPRVALPYVDGILAAIIPKVSDEFVPVSVAALRALQTLSEEAGTLLRGHYKTVMPLLCARVAEHNVLTRLDAALDAMAAFVRAAGRVIQPYTQHPNLLGILKRILLDVPSQSTTVAAMRLLGALGAIDPSRVTGFDVADTATAQDNTAAANAAAGGAVGGIPVGAGALVGGQRGSANPEDDTFPVGTDEFYLDTVMTELLEIATNQLLNGLYDRLSRTFVFIAVRARDRLVVYIPKLMPALISMARHCEPTKRPHVLGDTARIVDAYGCHMQPYLQGLLSVCRDFWLSPHENQRRTPQNMQTAVMTLLRALLLGLRKEIRPIMGDLLEHLLSVLAQDCTEDRQPTSQALEAISTIAGFLEDWSAAVVSKVLAVLGEYEETPLAVRSASISTLSALARAGQLGDHACHAVHMLCRTMKFERELARECLDALTRIIERYGPTIRRLGHAQTVLSVLNEISYVTPSPTLIAQLNGTDQTPPPPEEKLERSAVHTHANVDPVDPGRATKMASTLCHQLNEGVAPTTEWMEWMKTFTQTLLRESGSPWISVCVDVASAHEPLGKRLFTIALLSAWRDFPPNMQNEASDNLVEIARQHKVFAQLVLSTSELMSHSFIPLPPLMSDAKLTSLAVSSRAFAKALRYKENDFRRFFNTSAIYSGLSQPRVPATSALGAAIADLIELNHALQIPESAKGVLAFAQLHSDQIQKTMPPSWNEKTGEWQKALEGYQEAAAAAVSAAHTRALERAREERDRRRTTGDLDSFGSSIPIAPPTATTTTTTTTQPSSSTTASPSKGGAKDVVGSSAGESSTDDVLVVPEPRPPFDLVERQLACLDALGRWKALHSVVDAAWPEASGAERTQLAPWACAAAAGLGRWDSINIYQGQLPPDSVDTSIYRAMLLTHRGESEKALALLDTARLIAQPTLAALWNESYLRAYRTVMVTQVLSEMEEIIRYPSQSVTQQAAMRRTWLKRMKGAQQDSDVFGLLLKARSLVLRPGDDMDLAIGYVTICRLSGSATGLMRAHSYLVQLFGRNPDETPQLQLPTSNPRVTYAYIRLMWAQGRTAEAYQQLSFLADHLSPKGESNDELSGKDRRLLSRCYQRLALWHGEAKNLGPLGAEYTGKWTDSDIATVDDCYSQAAELARDWFKIWQNWANASFLATQYYATAETSVQHQQQVLTHAVTSVRAYFNAISLSRKGEANIRDILRLLALWFTHGTHSELLQSVQDGLNTVSVDTWLQVIPQLIARINLNDSAARQSLHNLLQRLGIIHPQALLFPLIVAARNVKAGDAHRHAANEILQQLKVHCRDLLEQAEMMADELIRVAILWSEMWSEGLEEASKFFSEGDYETMLTVLAPLHEKMEELLKASEYTEREKEFVDLFGKELQDAWAFCLRFRRGGPRQNITSAWDIYYSMYRRITKLLSQVSMLDLRDVSLKLATATRLKLVVPGTYRKTPEPVLVQTVERLLVVINSKQRPRRFTIRGSDGKVYEYLLKAREDLRQDERVMQLFGLVNTLMAADRELEIRHCAITTFFVLPLSPKLGLIQWLPTCDTMHSLVRAHRERIDKPLNLEVRLMSQIYPDYESLTLIQNVEVFQHALDNTPGDDLAQVLWHQSGDAEAWLERRLCYTRSVAVMSMVGHVLGLGDRHPSNLMLDRRNGAVIHVDFGDCFDIAMKRTKFPERVPFRLTRMMVTAMEATGVEGNFKLTCTRMMELMRRNSDSVLSVLEAFVHDPLIDWFARRKKDTRPFDTAAHPGHMATTTSSQATPPQTQMIRTRSGIIAAEEAARDGPNQRALDVLTRVRAKLAGREFNDKEDANSNREPLSVADQVDKLIAEARAQHLLCQHFTGWCPFW